MLKRKLGILLIVLAIAAASCTNQPATETESTNVESNTIQKQKDIKEEAITYKDGGTTLKGYLTYDASDSSKRPAILVVPEWWGLNDYVRSRAKQLAELGYVAMAVDMYGDGKLAADPKEAMAFASAFYDKPAALKARFGAAFDQLKGFSRADSSKISAIGYCFGGYVALNAAKMGANLVDVVSFHGSLGGVAPDKALLKAKILVCHGAADTMVSEQEVAQFKKGMDSIGATYTFKAYPNATHAFTNPEATTIGKKFGIPVSYNAAADSASWKDMREFLEKTL